MRVVDIDNFALLMGEWGKWMRDESLYRNLDYPRCDNLQKLRPRRVGDPTPPDITDDEAMDIYHAVVALFELNRVWGAVIVDYYQHGWTYVEIAELLNLQSRIHARQELDKALGWLMGYLSRKAA